MYCCHRPEVDISFIAITFKYTRRWPHVSYGVKAHARINLALPSYPISNPDQSVKTGLEYDSRLLTTTLLTLSKHRPQDEKNYNRADQSAAKPFCTCASK